jgi:prepilin-type processing-associated H-X9-DG protein
MSTEPEEMCKPSAKRNWIAAMVIVALLLGLSLTTVNASRERARRDECSNKLKELALAIEHRFEVHRRFPSAYHIGAKDRPMCSWRATLVPFFEQQGAFFAYKWKEPWDSPSNRLVANRYSDHFRCPARGIPDTSTSYVAIVGPETMWPGLESLSSRKLRAAGGESIRISVVSSDHPPYSWLEPRDLMSRTIMLVESADPTIHWMEPRDLAFDEASQGIRPRGSPTGISSFHPGGANVVYGDGYVRFLSEDTPPQMLRDALTITGSK